MGWSFLLGNMIPNVDSECQVAGVTKPTVWAARKSLAFLSFWYHNGTGAMQITKTTLRQLGVYIIIYIFVYVYIHIDIQYCNQHRLYSLGFNAIQLDIMLIITVSAFVMRWVMPSFSDRNLASLGWTFDLAQSLMLQFPKLKSEVMMCWGH